MIVEFELVKRETDSISKILFQDWYPLDKASEGFVHYSEKLEDLLRDGYVIENWNVIEEEFFSNELKLYFAMFAVLKDHEYHASAGYIFAYSRDRAVEMLKKQYGEETRVRSIEELKFEEGTVLYGERWHKIRAFTGRKIVIGQKNCSNHV